MKRHQYRDCTGVRPVLDFVQPGEMHMRAALKHFSMIALVAATACDAPVSVTVRDVLSQPAQFDTTIVIEGQLTAPYAIVPLPAGVIRHVIDHDDTLTVFMPLAADTFCIGKVRLPGIVRSGTAFGGLLRFGPIFFVDAGRSDHAHGRTQ